MAEKEATTLEAMMNSPFVKWKRLLRNSWTHGWINRDLMLRHLQAKHAGIDPDVVEAYPAMPDNKSSVVLKQTAGMLPLVAAAAIGAAALWGASQYLNQPETPATVDTDTDSVLQLDFFKPEG